MKIQIDIDMKELESILLAAEGFIGQGGTINNSHDDLKTLKVIQELHHLIKLNK